MRLFNNFLNNIGNQKALPVSKRSRLFLYIWKPYFMKVRLGLL